jgi:hypothetical protein
MRQKIVAATVCALGVISMTAGPGFAGEVNGQGNYIAGSDSAPLNGHSACAYSGLNDDYYVFGDTSARRTQNWGEFASVGVHVGVPGTECNPTRATGE